MMTDISFFIYLSITLNINVQYMSFLGIPWYNIVFSKHSKDWVVRKLFEPTTPTFREDLVRRVVECLKDKQITFKDRSSHVTLSSLPANIATQPKPDKQEAISKHQSRF